MTSLFDLPPTAQTSAAARDSIAPAVTELQRQVLDYLICCGADGATDDEMQRGIPLNPSTQRPRRLELQTMGLVFATEQRRRTASGRWACVFVARSSNAND